MTNSRGTKKRFDIWLNGVLLSQILRYRIETACGRTLLIIVAGMFSRIYEQIDTDNHNRFQIKSHNRPPLNFICRKVKEFSIKTTPYNELIQFVVLEGEISA
jgi:hypothetical protein